MRTVSLDHPADFDGWRHSARAAWRDGLRAGDVLWCTGNDDARDLFADEVQTSAVFASEHGASGAGRPGAMRFISGRHSSDRQGETGAGDTVEVDAGADLVVPRAFVQLAKLVVCHRDPERFALLYGLLIRLQLERQVLRMAADPLVKRVSDMAKAVRRDAHKMTAFVRFRKVDREAGQAPIEHATAREQFVAWFEPTYHIVRHCAPFFVKRFAAMDWSILTPDACVHWDGGELVFSDGLACSPVQHGDAMEEIWRSYYANIFNPARLKLSAMQSEMPKKYWKNLPEADLIPKLVRDARSRERAMLEAEATEPKAGMMAHKEVATHGAAVTPLVRRDAGAKVTGE